MQQVRRARHRGHGLATLELELFDLAHAVFDRAGAVEAVEHHPPARERAEVQRGETQQALQAQHAEQPRGARVDAQDLAVLDIQFQATRKRGVVDRHRRAAPGDATLERALAVAQRVGQAHAFEHVASVADVELEVQQRAAAFGRGSIALSRRFTQAPWQAPGAIAGELGARLFDGQAVERPDRLVVVMARMGLDLELAEFPAVQDEPVDAQVERRHFLDAARDGFGHVAVIGGVGDVQMREPHGEHPGRIARVAAPLSGAGDLARIDLHVPAAVAALPAGIERNVIETAAERIEHLGAHRHAIGQEWGRASYVTGGFVAAFVIRAAEQGAPGIDIEPVRGHRHRDAACRLRRRLPKADAAGQDFQRIAATA